MSPLDQSPNMLPPVRQLPPFRLFRPTTPAEAIEILGSEETPPVCYAGGTDLCLSVHEGRSVPSLLTLNTLDGLRGASVRNGTLAIGALATLDELSAHDRVTAIPGLAEALGAIANVRIRFRATIGGNVIARRTAYEVLILLTALDARLILESSVGRRELRAADIWTAGDLDRSLLTEIEIPLTGGLALDYDRTLRPWMTQAAVAGGIERVAVGTRFLRPALLSGDPGDAAETRFSSLPVEFNDVLLTRDYVAGTGAALLERQRARLAKG